MMRSVRLLLSVIILVSLAGGLLSVPTACAQDDPETCIENGVPPMMLGGIQQMAGIEGELPQPLIDMIAVMMCELDVPDDLRAEVDALVTEGVVTAEQVAQVEAMMGGGMPGSHGQGDAPSAEAEADDSATTEYPVSALTPADIPAPDASLFPRDVTFEDQTVTIEALPERIVVLSTDMGDVLMQLVPPSHFAAIPARMESGPMANYPQLAAAVETTLASEHQWDPEAILSYDPDLIVVHVRMQGETDALTMLADLGVPVIAFEAALDTPEQIAEMIRVLGQATGSDDRAEALASGYLARVDAVTQALDGVPDDERPAVLLLNTHGGGIQMIVGAGTVSDTMLRLAGGRSAAGEMGVESMTPTDTEQIIAANPDRIILIDFMGAGRDSFAPILDAPGMKTISAMQDANNILLLPARYLLLSSNNTIEGIEIIAAWLYPDLFGGE